MHDILFCIVPAVVEVAVGICDRGLVEQVVVGLEVGDVFAHGLFGDFVRIWFFGRDFLRGHVLLELALLPCFDGAPFPGGEDAHAVDFAFVVPGDDQAVLDAGFRHGFS